MLGRAQAGIVAKAGMLQVVKSDEWHGALLLKRV